MREFFGWTKDGGMPSVYVHPSGRDIDAASLRHYGISAEEKKTEDGALRPAVCGRCKRKSPAGAKFCTSCGAVLEREEKITSNSREGNTTTQFLEICIRKIQRKTGRVDRFHKGVRGRIQKMTKK